MYSPLKDRDRRWRSHIRPSPSSTHQPCFLNSRIGVKAKHGGEHALTTYVLEDIPDSSQYVLGVIHADEALELRERLCLQKRRRRPVTSMELVREDLVLGEDSPVTHFAEPLPHISVAIEDDLRRFETVRRDVRIRFVQSQTLGVVLCAQRAPPVK